MKSRTRWNKLFPTHTHKKYICIIIIIINIWSSLRDLFVSAQTFLLSVCSLPRPSQNGWRLKTILREIFSVTNFFLLASPRKHFTVNLVDYKFLFNDFAARARTAQKNYNRIAYVATRRVWKRIAFVLEREREKRGDVTVMKTEKEGSWIRWWRWESTTLSHVTDEPWRTRLFFFSFHQSRVLCAFDSMNNVYLPLTWNLVNAQHSTGTGRHHE